LIEEFIVKTYIYQFLRSKRFCRGVLLNSDELVVLDFRHLDLMKIFVCE